MFPRGLSIIERDRAAAYFASKRKARKCCVRDRFQAATSFASQLVMFDLPFNPDLLEQHRPSGPYQVLVLP